MDRAIPILPGDSVSVAKGCYAGHPRDGHGTRACRAGDGSIPAAPEVHRVAVSWTEVDAGLRAEADALLDKGLREVLATYGEAHVVGSYSMKLMAWRDLDVHLVMQPLDRKTFFELGGRLAALLTPERVHYRDETEGRSAGLPNGLYWGVYLGDERQGAWKLDIWATDARGLDRVVSYCRGIERRLSVSTRETILMIKSQCWQHAEYRRSFASGDIYEAVLDHGVRSVESFWTFLNGRA